MKDCPISVDPILSTAVGRFDQELNTVTVHCRADDFLGEAELEALRLQRLVQHRRCFDVHSWCDAVKVFDHGDSGTQSTPHRAEFEADVARTDDHEVRRHLRERKRACRRYDPILIDLDAAPRRAVRSGRDDDPAA